MRGYIQRAASRRIHRKKIPSTFATETAAIVIQKCVRGFLVRKAYHRFRQRLDTQILCFLQQIELLSQDFFTKIVKTNYSISFKNLEISALKNPNRYMQKFSQYLFPPSSPLSSTFTVLSPPLPPPNAPPSIKPSAVISSIALPPPPPALCLASRTSPQSRHLLSKANRSPSPSTSSVSKFAQVRDIFARAEAAAANVHHNHHHAPIKHHIANSYTSSPPTSSIERNPSPKPITVLDAVQQYQRQYLNSHQPGYKRFSHFGGAANNRPINFHGQNHVKPRGIGAFISSNLNNKLLLQNKQLPPVSQVNVTSNCTPSSPKPITRVSTSIIHQ